MHVLGTALELLMHTSTERRDPSMDWENLQETVLDLQIQGFSCGFSVEKYKVCKYDPPKIMKKPKRNLGLHFGVRNVEGI